MPISQNSSLQNNQIILEHKLDHIICISVEFIQEQVRENPTYDDLKKKMPIFSHMRMANTGSPELMQKLNNVIKDRVTFYISALPFLNLFTFCPHGCNMTAMPPGITFVLRMEVMKDK